MKGLTISKTRSGITVARVHYTADPEKDPATEEGMRWLEKQLQGIPGGRGSSAWRKEMEIDFSARSGKKVFEGLELMADKIFIDPFTVPQWWKVIGGYDYGKRNPFAYEELAIDGDANKYFIYEAYGAEVEVPIQAKLIKQSQYQASPRYADPSIWAEDQVDKRQGYTSLQKIFSDLGVVFVRGRTDDIAFVERLEAEWYDLKIGPDGRVLKTPKDKPTTRIFKTCPNFWQELIELRWAEFSPSAELDRGKREEIAQTRNHAWDAAKYAFLSLPMAPDKPKPRSEDPALPLAGELLGMK